MSGLPRRLLHGCAALLALALSAFGSPERIPAPERVMVRLAAVLVDATMVDAAPETGTGAPQPMERSCAAGAGTGANPGSLPAPCGACGPRAPCAA